MKILCALLFSIAMVSVSEAAPALRCENLPQTYFPSDAALVAVEFLNLSCKNKRGDSYYVEFAGIGPGLRFGDGQFVISCPLVRKKKLKGNYYGVKISAGMVGGATVGIFTNHRLGVCTIAGLEFLDFGASVTIGQLSIQ